MEDIANILKIRMDFFPTTLLYSRDNINLLLNIFESDNNIHPTHWGWAEKPKLKYDRDELLNSVLNEKKEMIFLFRNKAPKYICYFDVQSMDRLENFFSIEFDCTTNPKYYKNINELSDKLAEFLELRYGTSGLIYNVPFMVKSDLDKAFTLMAYTAQDSGSDFSKYGIRGLGFKTYFGESILNLYGKEKFMTAPALTQELSYGGGIDRFN